MKSKRIIKIAPEYWDEELECMPPDQLREIRTLKLHKYLRYTYQNSSYYKKLMDLCGIQPKSVRSLEDFQARIPLLRHVEILENQKTKPPFGDFLAVGLRDITRIYCSPGPLAMPFSKEDMDSYINATANGLYICGARRGDIVDISYAYQWDLAGTMLDDGFRRLGCAVVPGGPGMSKTHIRIMKHLGVTVLRAFPSFALKLAETAKKMGINPRKDLALRLIIIGGEICSDQMKERLAEEFSAEVREMYGWAETGFVAAECFKGRGMHCFSESIVEAINPVTCQVVKEGEAGVIVVTDLSRKAMPLIRYKTGDIVEGLITEPCECGRTSVRLQRIIGNTGEHLHIRGVHVTPEIIQSIIKRHSDISRFQIIIDKDGFSESVALRAEMTNVRDPKMITEKLSDELRVSTRLRVAIEFVPKGSISADSPILIDSRNQRNVSV
jgi:phenylacetate-CoA ligase